MKGKKVVRAFECQHCGHKLRFGSKVCGWCFRPTPIYNKYYFYYIIVLAAFIAVLLFLFS